jgi:HYDIN/CFA65/VesB-like, Ig-like domain
VSGRGTLGAMLAVGLAASVFTGASGASHTTQTQFLITPTRFEFGDVVVGKTSPAQRVTVTNATPAPIVVSMAGGAGGDFGGFQDCQGQTLAPAASCHITYQFTPTSPGSDTGSTSGSINGQNFAFDFHGTGVADDPEFLITPTRLDFGKVAVGTTSPDQQVTVKNVGRGPVVVSMAGGAGGDFGGFQDCQGKTLALGDTCHITYRFTPPGTGPDSGSTSGSINGQPFSFAFSGTGVGPRFRISPTRLDFGDVQVGETSADQQVAVTNIGVAPVVVSMAGGAGGDFGGFQDCQGKTLNVGDTCHITYRFTPPSPGPEGGSTSGSINGQPFSFNFTGNGVAPRFRISPTRFDFGEVPVGTTSPDQQVTVTNIGLAPAVVSMAGGAGGVFGGFQDCQGKTLNVGDSCHISYQFTPLGVGTVTGSTSGSINGQPFSFDFSGTGIMLGSQPTSTFMISPTRFDFGRVQTGTKSSDQQVTVTNISSSSVTVSMAGGAGGDFGGFQDCQGKTLAPGDTCHIAYQFTPPSPGPDSGSTSGSINGQPFAFDFSGTGVDPRFRISGTRLDFGDVPVGETSPDQQVAVTNIGLAPVVVSMAGGAGGDFGGFQDCQGKTLAPGDTCHISYQFTPPSPGPDSGSTSGSINGQPFAFDFTGNGVASAFRISPTRFEFGKVQVGQTSPDQRVTVTNISPSSVTVSMAGGAGGDFGGFQDCQGKTLAPGDSCHITYQFSPASAGPDTGSTSGSINGQPFAFDFRGTGVAPRFLITPTRFDFGEVVLGSTSPDQQVAVTNVGLAPVVVSMAGGAAGDFGGFQDCQGRTLNVGDTCHITYQFTPPGLGPDSGSTSGSINGQAFAFDFSGIGIPLVDTTPPVITPSVAPPSPDGTNGWYQSSPTVSFAVVDGESAIQSTSGCSPTVVSADTPANGVVLTCTATSGGGTSNKSVTIKRDATAPTVTCGATPTFALNGVGTVSASVADASSGPASATASAAADTSTLGTHSVQLTGADVAGNTTTVSCPYVVGLRFLGFLAPFKDSIKAGQQLVVRFALGDSAGAPIPDDLAQSLAASCAVRVTLIDASDCATYDPTTHAFLTQLRTARTAAAGTYDVVVKVTVGSIVVATASRSVQVTN